MSKSFSYNPKRIQDHLLGISSTAAGCSGIASQATSGGSCASSDRDGLSGTNAFRMNGSALPFVGTSSFLALHQKRTLKLLSGPLRESWEGWTLFGGCAACDCGPPYDSACLLCQNPQTYAQDAIVRRSFLLIRLSGVHASVAGLTQNQPVYDMIQPQRIIHSVRRRSAMHSNLDKLNHKKHHPAARSTYKHEGLSFVIRWAQRFKSTGKAQ